jgi:release factor glutamine methyltransferase
VGTDSNGLAGPVAPSCGAQLAWAERTLAAAGMPTPHDDALALLGRLAHVPSARLLAQPDRPLGVEEVGRYAEWVRRRADGEPLAHITGHLDFMGLDLRVDRRSPLARPGAARLVAAALDCLRARRPDVGGLLVAEVGTGCGAIALALGLLEPRIAHVYALDANADALTVARANGDRYLMNVLISWLEGETLEALPEPVDLIVAGWPDGGRMPEPADPRSRECSAESDSAGGLAHLGGVIARVGAKLRPGGELIVALGPAEPAEVARRLAAALPRAHVWFGPYEPHSAGGPLLDGERFAAAQMPR